MDDEVFNTGIRRFLKKVGITAQREIERAARQAVADGRLDGDEALPVTATIRIADLDLEVDIDGEIALE